MLILFITQMLVQYVQVILFAVDSRILMAIEIIKSASLRLEKKTHNQAQHQRVQLWILIYRPYFALFLKEIFFGHSNCLFLDRSHCFGLF